MAMHETVSQRVSLLRDMILSPCGVALDGRRRSEGLCYGAAAL